MGTTGVETAFAALFTELVMPGEIDLSVIVERMTAGAAVFDLATPRIAVGEAANLVVVDLDRSFEVGADGYVSRSENSAFHGRRLHGRVVLTLAAGSAAFRERLLVEAAPAR
jgi:dihydroorotase